MIFLLAQAQCWPVLASGRDIIGIAETGSGKTLAFSIPALAHLSHRVQTEGGAKKGRPMMLIIAPTRELAMQSQVGGGGKIFDPNAKNICSGCAGAGGVQLRGAEHVCVRRRAQVAAGGGPQGGGGGELRILASDWLIPSCVTRILTSDWSRWWWPRRAG